MPRFSSTLDCDIIAEHIEGNLVHDFRNDRVHFARHDRRYILLCREIDFPEAAVRTAAHESQVICNLGETHGTCLGCRRDSDESIEVLSSIDEIGSLPEFQAGDFAEIADNGMFML